VVFIIFLTKLQAYISWAIPENSDYHNPETAEHGFVEFPEFGVEPVISERKLAGSSWGVGVTVEALNRRNNGFHLQHLNSEGKSTGSRKLMKIFQETPAWFFIDGSTTVWY
jgi:hypothetical protein